MQFNVPEYGKVNALYGCGADAGNVAGGGGGGDDGAGRTINGRSRRTWFNDLGRLAKNGFGISVDAFDFSVSLKSALSPLSPPVLCMNSG